MTSETTLTETRNMVDYMVAREQSKVDRAAARLLEAIIAADARAEAAAKAESDRVNAEASKFWANETAPVARGAASIEALLGVGFLS